MHARAALCSGTDRDLKVDKLVGVGAHLVVEAEAVLADLVGGKDKVALSLLLTVEDVLSTRAGDLVVDVKGSSRLHGKVKGDLLALGLGLGEEA